MGYMRIIRRRLRILSLKWKPLIYLVVGILFFQAIITFNSSPNLLEEEKLRDLRNIRQKQNDINANAILQRQNSILAGDGFAGPLNPHDPEIRGRFVGNGAGSNVVVIEEQGMRNLSFPGHKAPHFKDERHIRGDMPQMIKSPGYVLNAPFKPKCEVSHKDATSAISRAKTVSCKQEIADVACRVQNGSIFPESMPRYCPHENKYAASAPAILTLNKNERPVKICFMLVVHGRAVRQFRRLFKVLYHSDHYYYVHVDIRSDHLQREVIRLAKKFPNVELAPWRMATIWGGSSLLQMLLQAMTDALRLWKDWDFFINLSASDFPIEPLDKLVGYLSTYRDKNFMKSHGRDDEKFIRKQGLNRVFVECEQHMWRLGERELPKGILLNGGSDWVALNRDYCEYIVDGNDQLLKDLKHWYRYTLLPAESFFHTLLQNSIKCESFVDNNLRVTNWNRARGCKCQYKHIVDWCGCSPNDFYPSDLVRLQTTRPVFFARKFEESINQEVVNYLDFKLYGKYPDGTPALTSYWENTYDIEDNPPIVSDKDLTHYHSLARIGVKMLNPQDGDTTAGECELHIQELKSVEMYRQKEEFIGYLATYEAYWTGESSRRRPQAPHTVTLQSLILRKPHLQIIDHNSLLSKRLEWAAVGTEWDVKELVLRDWGGLIGPLSTPRLVVRWLNAKEDFIVTIVVIDPLNVVADYSDFRTPAKAAGVTDTPLSLGKPLRPGKWKIKFYLQRQFQSPVAELNFVVAPLRYREGKTDDVSLVTDNRGVIEDDELNSAKRNLYTIRTTLNLPRDHGAERSLEERAAYVGEDLESWIDEVTSQVWTAEDVCLNAQNSKNWAKSLASVPECQMRHRIIPKLCSAAPWSSFSPDPKSDIGPIKPNGRIR